MKKSFLTIAVTMALSSAVFSGSVLSTQAFAGESISSDNDNSIDNTTETYLYPGMGVGAATGALLAGPVGLLVGGIIGAVAGASQDSVTADDPAIALSENMPADENAEEKKISTAGVTKNSPYAQGIQVAQLGTMSNVVDKSIDAQQDKLIDILTTDLSLDIFFRSGSTDIEAFYPARLEAVAELMNTMAQLELHLDGYSDRRGDKMKNIALSNQRIAKVRAQLIDAGVDENRIISKAFGEMKMVSTAGDLDAYTFDRKVVIRFERVTENSISTMTTALSDFEADLVETTSAEISSKDMGKSIEVKTPVVADASAEF